MADIRISNGASARKEKPRDAISICIDEIPKSNTITSNSPETSFKCENVSGINWNALPYLLLIFSASAITFGSRSNATTVAPAFKKACEYPPAPNVQSAIRKPRILPTAFITASKSTGTCFIIQFQPLFPMPSNQQPLLHPT